MRRFSILLIILALSPFANRGEAGGKDKKTPGKEDKKDYLIVVPPAGGKEVKLVDWRFTLGTRKFSLSETPGPEYLEVREEKSTTYRNGILTLVPLTSVKKITYERAKQGIAVIAVQANGDETTLVGHTKFTSNKITIEADAILEGLGSATVKFNGGTDKGLHSVTFPAPKPAAKVEGAPATVIADDKEKSQHPAYEIQALYLANGQYRVLPYIMFKKTVKVDLAKLAGLRYLPPMDKKKASSDYEITLKDGAKHTLTLLTTIAVDKKKMTFVGLVGRVPVGYRLFMLDAIYEYRAAQEKKE